MNHSWKKKRLRGSTGWSWTCKRCNAHVKTQQKREPRGSLVQSRGFHPDCLVERESAAAEVIEI